MSPSPSPSSSSSSSSLPSPFSPSSPSYRRHLPITARIPSNFREEEEEEADEEVELQSFPRGVVVVQSQPPAASQMGSAGSKVPAPLHPPLTSHAVTPQQEQTSSTPLIDGAAAAAPALRHFDSVRNPSLVNDTFMKSTHFPLLRSSPAAGTGSYGALPSPGAGDISSYAASELSASVASEEEDGHDTSTRGDTGGLAPPRLRERAKRKVASVEDDTRVHGTEASDSSPFLGRAPVESEYGEEDEDEDEEDEEDKDENEDDNSP